MQQQGYIENAVLWKHHLYIRLRKVRKDGGLIASPGLDANASISKAFGIVPRTLLRPLHTAVPH